VIRRCELSIIPHLFSPVHPPDCRMCELMFETFDVPAVFLCKDAVLSCYAVGRTSGLVIDCGASGGRMEAVCGVMLFAAATLHAPTSHSSLKSSTH